MVGVDHGEGFGDMTLRNGQGQGHGEAGQQPPAGGQAERNSLGMPVVGMIGGGQLARMTQEAALPLGQTLRVLAASSEESSAQSTPDVVLGSFEDLGDLQRFAAGCDAVTFDHEHVPQELLAELVASGVNVQPPPSALLHAQDKLVMRERLAAIGAPVPPYAEVSDPEDAARFVAAHGDTAVLKARRGGYDGKGVWMLTGVEEARAVAAEQLEQGVPLMIEQRVFWERELSALVARSPFGQGAVWPVVETIQRGGICHTVIAPAQDLSEELRTQAHALALTIAGELGVTGVLAVELFEFRAADGSTGLLVNELAMRPHNSGHWTQDGAITSQFEQHLRAVLDLPLGSTLPVVPLTIMANVLGAEYTPEMSMDERVHHLGARFPHVKVHLYGKSERPGRKLGHVNVVGSAPDQETFEETLAVAELASNWLATAQWADGWDPHEGAPVGQFRRGGD